MLVNPSLTKGSVEFLILSILEDGESHGYHITQQIEERSQRLRVEWQAFTAGVNLIVGDELA